MVKGNGEDERIDELIKKAYKGRDKEGGLVPKTWCYCSQCTTKGAYEWCPGKKEKFDFESEDGCPLGNRVLN